MSLHVEVKTGNTIGVVVEVEKKKQKIYWDENTEAAVKEFLALDFKHLTSKLETYLKQQAMSGNYDSTIDDGYVAELRSGIKKSGTERARIKKEIIFRSGIKGPLNKLIENIIFSFKLFRYDIDVKTLHNDCMSHVYEKFYKFDPDQNTKSFSYFGTIAKHYLQNRKKELDMLKSINLNYDDHAEEVDSRESYEIHGTDTSDEMMDLFNFMIGAFEKNMNNKALNDNDRKVLDSILELFKSHGDHKMTKEEFDSIETGKNYSPNSHKSRMLTNIWEKKHGGGDVLDDNKYSKGNILDFILDRSKISKEDMGKSLTKLRNLYKEKRKDFYNTEDQD